MLTLVLAAALWNAPGFGDRIMRTCGVHVATIGYSTACDQGETACVLTLGLATNDPHGHVAPATMAARQAAAERCVDCLTACAAALELRGAKVGQWPRCACAEG